MARNSYYITYILQWNYSCQKKELFSDTLKFVTTSLHFVSQILPLLLQCNLKVFPVLNPDNMTRVGTWCKITYNVLNFCLKYMFCLSNYQYTIKIKSSSNLVTLVTLLISLLLCPHYSCNLITFVTSLLPCPHYSCNLVTLLTLLLATTSVYHKTTLIAQGISDIMTNLKGKLWAPCLTKTNPKNSTQEACILTLKLQTGG